MWLYGNSALCQYDSLLILYGGELLNLQICQKASLAFCEIADLLY